MSGLRNTTPREDCFFLIPEGLSSSIRTNGGKEMTDCENTRTVVVFGKNQKDKKAVLFNPRCKQWNCDYCAEENKNYWIHQAERGVLVLTMEGQQVQFVTLTSRPYATPTTGLYFLQQNWPKLSRKMKYHTNKYERNLGVHWSYFLVPEKHKTGVVHCHILAATIYNTEASWKDFAFSAGFGWKIDVQPLVSPEKAGRYVAKYLHKGSGKEAWPPGFRRVRKSRNWPTSEEVPLGGWVWETYKSPFTVWTEKHALVDMGWTVIDKTE